MTAYNVLVLSAAPDRMPLRARPGLKLPYGKTLVTIYYRTAGGSRGSTTLPEKVPAGAVVERRVPA